MVPVCQPNDGQLLCILRYNAKTRDRTPRTPHHGRSNMLIRLANMICLAREAAVHLLHCGLVGAEKGTAVGLMRVPTASRARGTVGGLVARPRNGAIGELDVVVLVLARDLERLGQRGADLEAAAVVDGVAQARALGGLVDGVLVVVHQVDDGVQVGRVGVAVLHLVEMEAAVSTCEVVAGCEAAGIAALGESCDSGCQDGSQDAGSDNERHFNEMWR